MPPLLKPRPARNAVPGKTGNLANHLAGAASFVRLSEHAARLQRLQVLLDDALPAHLLPGTRIANLKQGKVVIHADSGAVAVKLRQMAPRLAAGFCQQGQEVTSIEVKVQGRRRLPTMSRKKGSNALGLQPKRMLTSLASGLEPDSPLREAIEKLVRNS